MPSFVWELSDDIAGNHLSSVCNVVWVSAAFSGYAVCPASTLTPCVSFELLVSEMAVRIVV